MHTGFRLIGLISARALRGGAKRPGTITGTIADRGGAVIPNAPIEAKNLSTGLVYPTASTGTGNFTIPELSPGQYLVTANAPGFKQYMRQGLVVAAAETHRVDITLQAGAESGGVDEPSGGPVRHRGRLL